MVFGFKKKRRQTTFKDRVAEFWTWYVSRADRFFETIEQGRCEDLTSEVGEFVQDTLPNLSWVFGPGEKGGHSFTVTGEGQVARQLLAEYWCRLAPEVPNWTFYGSRQPTPAESLANFVIRVSEQKEVDVKTFMLQTSVDDA